MAQELKTFPFFKGLLRQKPPTEFETNLGYEFRDKGLMQKALSHRSYVYHQNQEMVFSSNERMEFLGDAVLDILVSEYLYQLYLDYEEGRLSKLKSLIVSAKVLERSAKQMDLGPHILVSAPEEKAGGRERQSILSDTFEAVLGAVYLDGGLKGARRVLENCLFPLLPEILNDESLENYKSLLLEYSQSKGFGIPEYRVLDERGPEHKKIFKVAVFVSGENLGTGEGYNKKSAEQLAAKLAMEHFEGVQESS